MSIKRKWLKVVMLAMMAGASFGSPVNPKEVEDLMNIMNQTRIEFTVPDDDDKGDGGKTGSLFLVGRELTTPAVSEQTPGIILFFRRDSNGRKAGGPPFCGRPGSPTNE